MKARPLQASQVAAQLAGYPRVSCWWVAYSGGLDSHVLLHCLANLPTLPGGATLKAVYVNHGLSPQAEAWAVHCQTICQGLQVPLQVLRVEVEQAQGESLEEKARQARYQALQSLLSPQAGMVTAHHQDDQAETLLLMLLRGSGLPGLAAMPALAKLGPGPLGRPLLGYSRAMLQAYAVSHGLRWVEDESNQSPDFDRNYLRHQIIPQLRSRWPGLSKTLARSAEHCGAAEQILQRLATENLANARPCAGRLTIDKLCALDPGRQANLLRAWIRAEGFPAPDTRHLARLQHELITAQPDRNPVVAWADAEVRRFKGELYVMPVVPAAQIAQRWTWTLQKPLTLSPGAGVLKAIKADPARPGLRMIAQAEVRFRQGGEQCLLAKRGSHSLKKLLQADRMPPWWRSHIPLLYVDGQLAAVADGWVCAPFLTRPGEAALTLVWDHPFCFQSRKE